MVTRSLFLWDKCCRSRLELLEFGDFGDIGDFGGGGIVLPLYWAHRDESNTWSHDHCSCGIKVVGRAW